MSDTTIAAVATPPGTGGIAVIRLSGTDAVRIFCKVWKGSDPTRWKSHTVHLGNIFDPATGSHVDEVVATLFRAPASYTGEDTIEISCHGSALIQNQITAALIKAGATAAGPGEFTRRAFLNGRIDLAQAEAIADLIAAESKGAHDLALSQTKGEFSKALATLRDRLLNLASLLELELDFSEEDVEFADRTALASTAADILAAVDRLTASYEAGQAFRQGIAIAIAGTPNTGKSTLLNYLAHDDKAIVSDIPGTTRDTIEAEAEYHGLKFRFIDTAGLRETTDKIENLGINRAIERLRSANYVFWLIDPTQPIEPQTALLRHHLDASPEITSCLYILASKADALPSPTAPCSESIPTTDIDCGETSGIGDLPARQISSRTGLGIDGLLSEIARRSTASLDPARDTLIANARHFQALTHAADSLRHLTDAMTAGLPADLLAQHLRETLHHLGAITGAITTPDILTSIFTRFCIGK